MLVLLFYLGNTMYTMKCDRVREVAPIVSLKEVPHAPDYVAGLFNYRGVIVPVIDLRRLIQGKPCQMRMSTRIILVDYVKEDNTPYILGLMAERVTETARRDETDFVAPGLQLEEAPYLGGLMMQEQEMIQYVDLDLLPESFQFLPALIKAQNEK
ncbi:MAG: chemotaxis protein CheW [Deltaproteobacteria bacterium]|jgi:chemotaxis-related protein WspB|nr:chemotaxis protein CheW [Deltaproteobacteria bacterium]